MTQELDLAELRKIVEAATPGPWEAKPYIYGVDDDGRIRVTSPSDSGNYNLAESVLPNVATHIATFDPETVLELIERAEAAEQALDFHTQRDRELKALLSMLSDRLDGFSYDELSSLVEDKPLNQWGESYKSRIEQAEQAVARVRRVLADDAWEQLSEYGLLEIVPVENIVEALDGEPRG